MPAANMDDAGWSPLHYALAAQKRTPNDARLAALGDLVRASSLKLSDFDAQRPRNDAADGYLNKRGAHVHLPVAARDDVLNGERSLRGIAARLQRTDLPAPRVVVLLGAGVSTAAGIPDYRSATGRYATAEGRSAFSASAVASDPAACWDYLRATFGPAARGEIAPAAAHRFVGELHARGMLQRVYTQNVDGLEMQVGVPDERIVCCHGSVRAAWCASCGASADACAALAMREGAPRCTACADGVVRPGVVWFGEPLPAGFERHQVADLEACTLLLVMGTTLQGINKPRTDTIRHYTAPLSLRVARLLECVCVSLPICRNPFALPAAHAAPAHQP
jgi:NAD-dependent SIR2 family protein deacetylase